MAKPLESNSSTSAEGTGLSDGRDAVLIRAHMWEVDKEKIHIRIATTGLSGEQDEYGFPLGGE